MFFDALPEESPFSGFDKKFDPSAAYSGDEQPVPIQPVIVNTRYPELSLIAVAVIAGTTVEVKATL